MTVSIIRKHAINAHAFTNHTYGDGQPYRIHLQMVVDTAEKFIHLIPEGDRNTVIMACWLHDVIEDCRETYNDVKKVAGEQVADIVYALTNEKGKNRAERANDKYYQGIRDTTYASFVKLCDRIANAQYSVENGSRMAEMYRKENASFLAKVCYGDPYNIINPYGSMVHHLEEILK